MNLRERLRSLGGATARPKGPERAGPSEMRQSADPNRERRVTDADRQPIDSSTDAQALDFGADIPLHSFPTDAGPAVGTETSYSLDYEQGRIPLHTALGVSEQGWMRFLPMADRPFPIENAVFLDLETTGLARGAGTYAFLIGVGRFNEGGFRLRQFFMRDYDEELPHLKALRAELEGAEAIVTFNGRSFDWPLLETRGVMNRLRLPLLPHLDLLHPARRVWRPVIGGCRLIELEEQVLGVQREDDVPGHLIPQRYFDFLQTGDAAPLADVVVHNRLDILSMVALVGHIGQALASPRRRMLADEALSGAELFTIGRWLLPDEEGVACLEEALYRGLPAELRRQCRRLLATAYRRAGRAEEALPVLEKLVDDDGLSTWAYVELAKYYEHRARDFATAREWTLRALDVLQRRRQLGRAVGGGAGRTEAAGAARTAPSMGSGAGPGARLRPDRLDEEFAEVLHRLRRVERKYRSIGS